MEKLKIKEGSDFPQLIYKNPLSLARIAQFLKFTEKQNPSLLANYQVVRDGYCPLFRF